MVNRTGYTGERGVELMCPVEDAPALWDAVVARGAKPCGLGARDTLRLEVCYPLHGNDITPDTDAISAGLGWTCALDTEFTGAGELRRIKAEGPEQKLVAVRHDGEGDSTSGYDDRRRRQVTSGSHSPMLDVGIGMGYVPAAQRATRDRPRRSTCAAGRAARASWRSRSTSGRRRVVAAAESYPDELKYHAEHDWARVDGDEATLGITWFAQDALGELVHYEAPDEGSTISKDESYGEVESVKAVSDLIAPLSGEVLEVNAKVVDAPETVNDDPYGEGWLIRIRLERCVRARRAPGRGRLPRTARERVSYLSLTDADRDAMLATIGVDSVEELFRDIPAGMRFGRELDLEPPLTEAELQRHLEELAARNVDTTRELSFLGAGIYDHYVPAIADAVLQRGEFLTAYTPYQPEMSQGVLQAIFEYQTAICELTGMDVSNASGYDGTTVAADACYIAKHATGRSKIVVTEATNPQVRQVVKTYAPGFGLEVVEVPHANGATDPDAARDGRRGCRGGALPAAELLRRARAGSGPRRGRDRRRRARGRARRPDVARRARGARRLRLRARDRRGPGHGQLPALRRPALRLPRRAQRVHPAHARPDHRRDDRPGRRARLRVDAADPRAAHPSREGDLQHHDEPDAARAAAGWSTLVARAARAPRGGGDLHEPRRVCAGEARARLGVSRTGQRSRSLPCAPDGARAT